MTDHATSDQLLDAIAQLKASPALRRFRVLCALSREIQAAVETINLETREQERLLRETDGDIEFIKHHRGKLDICYRAMRGTYEAPDRAMAIFNGLCKDATTEALMEALNGGSSWLGKPMGGRFLWIISQTRRQADANYLSAVIPALLKILPDQKIYLELIAANLEFEHSRKQEVLRVSTSERLALDVAQREFEREILIAAIDMTPDDLKRLEPEQDEYRAAVALIEQNNSTLPSKDA